MYCTKQGHTANICYLKMLEIFQRKLNYLMNESLSLGNMLMQKRKENVKRDENIPPHNGSQRNISNGVIKVTRVKKIWVKNNDQSVW